MWYHVEHEHLLVRKMSCFAQQALDGLLRVLSRYFHPSVSVLFFRFRFIGFVTKSSFDYFGFITGTAYYISELPGRVLFFFFCVCLSVCLYARVHVIRDMKENDTHGTEHCLLRFFRGR